MRVRRAMRWRVRQPEALVFFSAWFTAKLARHVKPSKLLLEGARGAAGRGGVQLLRLGLCLRLGLSLGMCLGLLGLRL